MTTQTAAPTFFPPGSILERVPCIDPREYMREVDRTPSWARWLDGSPGFIRLKQEYWAKLSAQPFFDAADGLK